MNKQLKKLDKQAVDWAMSVVDATGCYQNKEYLQVVKEKFAELILQECLEVSHRHQSDCGCRQAIKSHFGVK